MTINRRIIEKIKDKTEDDLSTRKFLIKLLEKESEGLGWFKNEYKELLNKYGSGDEVDENN